MRNPSLKTAQLILLAALTAAGAGCGANNKATKVTPVTLPAGSHDPTGSQLAQVPVAVQTALFGTYYGKLETASTQQSYEVTLRPATVAGNATSFGYAQFVSSGARSIRFEVPLNLVFRDYPLSNGARAFGFVSVARVVSGLSDHFVSVQLIISLNGTNQFDPTQSWFFIKDCGFFQAVDCSSTLDDPRILTLLGKR
jgi:hypothetical protein